MKILITGATGFVGQNLVPKLIKENHKILEITVEPEKSKKLYKEFTDQFYYNESNFGKLRKVISDFSPEIVIHLASFLTANDDLETLHKLLKANIEFTCIILDSLKETDLKWFFNVGSFAEYFNGDGVLSPAYLYAATKSAARIFVDYYSSVYNFKYLTIIPYTIYGGKDSQKKIIDLIYDSTKSKQALDISPGMQTLDFIHLEDVTDFFVDLINNINVIDNKSDFHLGTGKGITLRDIANLIEKYSGSKTNINWGGKAYRPRDVMYAVADTTKQNKAFGWKPKIKIEDGIIDYLKEKGHNEISR